jgi:hypothetical protein
VATPAKTAARVEFGHPEFWTTVRDASPRFFQVHPRLVKSFNSLVDRPSTNLKRDQKVVFDLCLMAGIATEELVTLVGNGLGVGAMKIARNLLELSINAEYLRMNPTAVDDFVDWFWVEQHKWLAYAQQHDPELLKTYSSQVVADTEREFARVRTRFQLPNNPTKIRGSWCAVDLGTRAVQTHMEVPYRLINPFGSQFLHGTPSSLLNHFESAREEQIAVPPSLKWCRQALCGGHCCLLGVIQTLEVMFDQEGVPCTDELVKDFQIAWPETPAVGEDD